MVMLHFFMIFLLCTYNGYGMKVEAVQDSLDISSMKLQSNFISKSQNNYNTSLLPFLDKAEKKKCPAPLPHCLNGKKVPSNDFSLISQRKARPNSLQKTSLSQSCSFVSRNQTSRRSSDYVVKNRKGEATLFSAIRVLVCGVPIEEFIAQQEQAQALIFKNHNEWLPLLENAFPFSDCLYYVKKAFSYGGHVMIESYRPNIFKGNKLCIKDAQLVFDVLIREIGSEIIDVPDIVTYEYLQEHNIDWIIVCHAESDEDIRFADPRIKDFIVYVSIITQSSSLPIHFFCMSGT